MVSIISFSYFLPILKYCILFFCYIWLTKIVARKFYDWGEITLYLFIFVPIDFQDWWNFVTYYFLNSNCLLSIIYLNKMLRGAIGGMRREVLSNMEARLFVEHSRGDTFMFTQSVLSALTFSLIVSFVYTQICVHIMMIVVDTMCISSLSMKYLDYYIEYWLIECQKTITHKNKNSLNIVYILTA